MDLVVLAVPGCANVMLLEERLAQVLPGPGIRPAVESVEVDRDAVVLGMTLSQPAEGARSAPAESLYQVFTVDNGEVIEIRGYPDRASALARP